MADNNLAAMESQQSNTDEPNTLVIEDRCRGDSDSDRYSRCRAQDIYQLLDVFLREVRKAVPCDGIEYREDALGLQWLDGIPGRHRCNYRIRIGDQLLGEVNFSREKPFSDRERVDLENLLAGLGTPLRNALRYQRAVRFALRDGLTGLRNGSAFQDSIAQEVERARRYRSPFSLLLVNIDDFGAVNEQFGRAAGDAVLVENHQHRQSDHARVSVEQRAHEANSSRATATFWSGMTRLVPEVITSTPAGRLPATKALSPDRCSTSTASRATRGSPSPRATTPK